MQKVQRPRQLDYSKPIVKLTQQEEFISEEERQKDKDQINKPDKKAHTVPIPKAVDLNTNGIPEKKRRHSNGYIRLEFNEQLPLSEKYDLTESDKEFLKKLPSPPWNQLLLEKAIETAEKLSTREIIVKFEEYEAPCKEATGISEGVQDIYNYIKGQRETLKRPLLRSLWKPSADDPNPYVAFRPRDKEKMKLRRNRENDKEALNKMKLLKNELEMARGILEGVRLRETVKVKQIEHTINPKSFTSEENSKLLSEVKQFLSKPSRTYLAAKEIYPEKTLLPVKIIPKENVAFAADENKDYDVSAFLSTLLLEGIPRNLIPTNVNNPSLLNEIMHPNSSIKNPVEVIQIPKIPKASHGQHSIRTPNILPFKVRRRQGRGGRIFLDRFIEDMPFLGTHAKTLSSTPLKLIKEEENLILEEKFKDIKEVYCYSDTEDEFESTKSLKSIIGSLKNSLKQKRILTH